MLTTCCSSGVSLTPLPSDTARDLTARTPCAVAATAAPPPPPPAPLLLAPTASTFKRFRAGFLLAPLGAAPRDDGARRAAALSGSSSSPLLMHTTASGDDAAAPAGLLTAAAPIDAGDVTFGSAEAQKKRDKSDCITRLAPLVLSRRPGAAAMKPHVTAEQKRQRKFRTPVCARVALRTLPGCVGRSLTPHLSLSR